VGHLVVCKAGFAGLDMVQGEDFVLMISQECFSEAIEDPDVPRGLLRQSDKELACYHVTAWKKALGSLALLATQTHYLLSGRVGLYLSDLAPEAKLKTAQKIQQVIREAREEVYDLRIGLLEGTANSRDVTVTAFCDACFHNRANRVATGGYIFFSGQQED
jgi:hypothetical protein